MAEQCAECGEETRMPYTCNYCAQTHCTEHRLPENHVCASASSSSDSTSDKWFKESLSSSASRRSTTTTTSSREDYWDHTIDRLAGKTTFRRPGESLLFRILALFLYPIAVVDALIEIPIYIALLTAFAPLRTLSSYVASFLTLTVFLSIGLVLVPESALPEIGLLQQWRDLVTQIASAVYFTLSQL